MRKNILKCFLIACVMLMAASGSSFAEVMRGDAYRIPTNVLDGGGTLEVSAGGYKIMSSVGQTGSISTSAGGDYIIQQGYLYTRLTEGNIPNLTSIYRLWINSIDFNSGDILPPNRANNVVFIEVDDDAQDVPTVVMLLDGINVSLTGPLSPPPPQEIPTPPQMFKTYWRGTFATPTTPPTTHYLTFYTSDEVVNEGIVTLEAMVIAGAAQVVGRPLNYPNPFRPLSGGPDAVTKIQYTLSDSASITIII
ncbi:hypothetical protein ACFL4F_04200, partial [Candidatus Margulisiibacteriota bacterium]